MEYAQQPRRAIYLSYQLFTTLFFRAPYWLLTSIPRSWRPRRSWDLKRAFLMRVLRHANGVTSHSGPFVPAPSHLAITPGPDVNGVWVDPVPELIAGELKTWAFVADVSYVRIPGYWMHKKGTQIDVGASPKPGEKVILALHGGAYYRLSAHPSDPTSHIARGYLKHLDSVQRVFSLEYRLSKGDPEVPAHPFPTALTDALAGYNYLVSVVGFSPSDIILDGDSAGGNLAMALTRYLVESRDDPQISGIPLPPSALILLSPWSDLGTSQDGPKASTTTNLPSDYIGNPANGITYAKNAFLGPHGLGSAEVNRYISPASLHDTASVSFKGFPRTFLVAGGAEVLIDQLRTLKRKMVKDMGEGDGVKEGDGKLRYYEAEDGVHDYLVLRFHEPERTETFKEIGKWVAA